MIELKYDSKLFKFINSAISSLAVFLVIILLVFFVWTTIRKNEKLSLESGCEVTARLNAAYLEDSNEIIKDAIENMVQLGYPITDPEKEDWNRIAEVYINTSPEFEYIALYNNNFELQMVYPESSSSQAPEYFMENTDNDDGKIDVLYPIYHDRTLMGFVYTEINISTMVRNLAANDDNFNFMILSDSDTVFYGSVIEHPRNYPYSEVMVKLDTIGIYKLKVWPSKKHYSTSMAKANQFIALGIMSSVMLLLLLLFLQNRIKESKMVKEQNSLFIKQIENEQRLESIGILSSSVAHEINNPINGIMNYIQLIKEVIPPEAEEYSYADEITNETERIASLVKNILNFSRKSSEFYSLANVKDIINRTRNLADTLLLKDRIDLEVIYQDDIPAIRCSTNKIQQVLLNLIINARDSLNEKYTSYDKNKKIQMSCSIDVRNDIKGVTFKVKDYGMGIDEKVGAKIFDSFYTTKPEGIGTGLGLFISKRIIDDHNGEIWFESIQGQETTFNLFIPYQKD